MKDNVYDYVGWCEDVLGGKTHFCISLKPLQCFFFKTKIVLIYIYARKLTISKIGHKMFLERSSLFRRPTEMVVFQEIKHMKDEAHLQRHHLARFGN